jgi:uncharacterized protein (TIGR02118 family)
VVKRLTLWRPRASVGRDEALRYWRDEHVRFIARVPGVKRYVQNHCIVGPGGAAPASAGLGELWFDSVEAAEAALATDEWNAVIDDAAMFMDMDHVTAVWAEAHQIL